MAPLPQRVFISSGSVSTFFTAHHPRSGVLMQFAVAGDRLLEVQCLMHLEPKSWLWAEHVQQDGRLFIANPIDPLFMLLPHLIEARGSSGSEHPGLYKPLSDILEGEDAAVLETHVLALPSILQQLRGICDVNEKYDEPMVRLNNDKVLNWLRRKTIALQQHLAKSHARTGGTEAGSSSLGDQFAHEPSFVVPDAHDDKLLVALSFVAEYLIPASQQALAKSFGVSAESVAEQRSSRKDPKSAATAYHTEREGSAYVETENHDSSNAKKQKVPPAKKPKVVQTLKPGQRTMASFFTKR